MKFSYSRVNCYKTCPYQYYLKYVEQLKTLPNYDANNALHLGSAMHTGIETTVERALAQYFSNYPVIDDLHINEAIKLEYIIPLAKKVIPAGKYEKHVESDSFVGFIDLLVPKGDNHFDIYDFKYSNNVDSYMKSVQLHVYKYFYELTHPGHVIDNLYYLFLPKTQIRQKKTEDLFQFRKRLLATLGQCEVRMFKVEYDPQKVRDYLAAVEEIKAVTEYPKNCTRLCDWCEYQTYCTKGDTTMILPKNERRALGANSKKKIWLYGAPYSGKTTLADRFPDPLMLNTDDNVYNVTAPYISIKDVVTTTGNATKRKQAWDVFLEVIEELEKKQNDYKTIIVDLVEGVYEHCRTAIYKKLGIDHEHDAGFGKGYDMVRKEFLDAMKRLTTLDYENIILISHEDVSKSVTSRGGSSVTTITPNLPDKVAKQLSGMVGLTARVVVHDGKRKLVFKTDEHMFGGGRLTNVRVGEIPLTYEALMQMFADNPTTEAPAEAPTRRRVVENN